VAQVLLAKHDDMVKAFPPERARLISRINWRISSGTFGLPPRDRDFHRQN
jgi:hypothetical protein